MAAWALFSNYLQYGDLCAIFKLFNNYLSLCYFRKEMAQTVKFETYNWMILGSNHTSWTIFFKRILSQVYRVSHVLRSLLRESVPYVKIYRYNPKHLCTKLNVYGDNGKRKVWTSWSCTHYTCQLAVIYVRPCVGCHVTEYLLTVARSQELLVCSRREYILASDRKQSSRFVQWVVTVNTSFSYEEYAEMHFVYGFATVTPLLLSKNIGYDILDDESLTDVCSLVYINICEKKVPFQV